ncbi:MAG: hypothetical protein V1815_00300 [Candidatus Woesearchaeota archaeon]
MKRGVFVVVLLLLMLPSTFALININGPSLDIVNLGDKIHLEGYVQEDIDVIGFFKLELNCGSKQVLSIKVINILKGQKYSFSEDLPIIGNMLGSCNIIASVENNGVTLEQVNSKNFVISKDLNGEFKLEQDKLQLGKYLILNGTIQKKDGSLVNGLATLYFKQGDNIYIIDTTQVKNGELNYIKRLKDNVAGIYNIDIYVIEDHGNEQKFSNIASFSISNQLTINVDVDKNEIKPGEVILIKGNALNILQENVDNASVKFLIDNSILYSELKNGKFDDEIKTEKNIKSGLHNIEVIVTDSLGNSGDNNISINIIAVPTTLANYISGATFRPENNVIVRPILLDQAGDIINNDVTIEIRNKNNDLVGSKTIKSNESYSFILAQYSVPGKWTVKSFSSGLDEYSNFYVNEIMSIIANVENQTLSIKNIGNVEYDKQISVLLKNANGKETQIKKRISLNPNEIMYIDLTKEVETGTYNIMLENFRFDNVKISAKPKPNYTWLYTIVLLIVLLLLIPLFKKRNKIMFNEKINKMKRQKGFTDKPIRINESIESRKTLKFTPKKTSTEYRFKEPQKETYRNNDNKGGLFNMFK